MEASESDMTPEEAARMEDIARRVAEGDPLTPTDWTIEKERAAVARRAKIRQYEKEIFSQSPLYQARAEKDPTYWETACFGGVWLPEDFDADGNLMPHHLKRREEGGFPPFN